MESFNLILLNIAQSLPGFLLAIVAHEWAHAYVAHRFGDNTAQSMGRMTLNPAAHLDMWGTILFPLIAAISGWAMIGWAKPVPIDSRNFRNFKKGIFWVSFAGPLMNFILGTLSAILFAFVATKVDQNFAFYKPFLLMLKYSIFINFILGFYNLIPLPPLDGSNMLASFLNYNAMRKYQAFAAYTPMILLGLLALSMMGIHILGQILWPAQFIGEGLTLFFLRLFS